MSQRKRTHAGRSRFLRPTDTSTRTGVREAILILGLLASGCERKTEAIHGDVVDASKADVTSAQLEPDAAMRCTQRSDCRRNNYCGGTHCVSLGAINGADCPGFIARNAFSCDCVAGSCHTIPSTPADASAK